jgi:lambda repressor-like predicted transcriptional regulator
MRPTPPEVVARVQRLVRRAGLSIRQAARECQVAPNTVQKCLRATPPEKTRSQT